MRPLLSLLSLSLSAAAGVSAYDARAYTFESRQSDTAPVNRIVAPQTARLILANRLGLSEGTTLGAVDEKAIQNLNIFGGKQTAIFGDLNSEDDLAKMLLVWEGVDVPDLASTSKYSADSFSIPNSPADLVDTSYIHNLISQSSATRPASKLCRYAFDVDGGFRASLILYADECPSKDALLPAAGSFGEGAFLKFLSQGTKAMGGPAAILRISSETNTPAVRKTVLSTLAALSKLVKDANQESTMIFAGSGPSENTLTRRTFDEPEPLQVKADQTAQRAAKFPSTLMPVCYADESACSEATQNCSGHGSCYRKYGAKDGSSMGDCYACKCKSTVVRTNKDGSVKTVQWGGAACQKKDVSIPFFMIAGLTILLVMAIGGGISMLFSVGMEELPSVIGAGVTAPRQK
ncbi:hypothetical protein FQN53_004285 [Emmonsiellopsis sp. PD_33]|nr:hypothetical protein FQN53_004285 [Emmonsiellopsis sp. PD_33]